MSGTTTMMPTTAVKVSAAQILRRGPEKRFSHASYSDAVATASTTAQLNAGRNRCSIHPPNSSSAPIRM